MELKELRKEAHLSASSIGDYMTCGFLYKLGRIDRFPPEFRSDAMELGSCIHLALADFHKQKMDGKIMTAKELHERFERYWKAAAEGQENIQYCRGKRLQDPAHGRQGAFDNLLSQVPPRSIQGRRHRGTVFLHSRRIARSRSSAPSILSRRTSRAPSSSWTGKQAGEHIPLMKWTETSS